MSIQEIVSSTSCPQPTIVYAHCLPSLLMSCNHLHLFQDAYHTSYCRKVVKWHPNQRPIPYQRFCWHGIVLDSPLQLCTMMPALLPPQFVTHNAEEALCLRDPEILMGRQISLLFPNSAAQCKLAGKSFRCSLCGSRLSTVNMLTLKMGIKVNAMLVNSNFRHASKWQLTPVGDSKRLISICEYAYSASVPQLIISKTQWQMELDDTLKWSGHLWLCNAKS